MKAAVDKSGLVTLTIDTPHRTIYDDWESLEHIPFAKNYKNDKGQFCCERIPVDETLKNVTWDDDPVDVKFIIDEEGPLWVFRDKDGTLGGSFTEPHRNIMHPWWSATNKLYIIEPKRTIFPNPEDPFPELTWEDTPIRVKIVRALNK